MDGPAVAGQVESGVDAPTDERCRGQRGVVLVIFALLLLVLLAMAGFAVDLGHWYYEANRVQKAADSAALAGAVFLPGNLATARTVAEQHALRNGYVIQDQDVVAIASTQLQVTVHDSVKNFFIGAIGLKTQSISRTAIGEFEGPVDMGSPANTFGNEPPASNDATLRSNVAFPGNAGQPNQPLFWGNIAGPQTPKENGDAYAAGWCSQATPDHCDFYDTNPLHNADFKPTGGDGQDGYFFTVHVPAVPATKRFQIQVYDPAFVNVGDHCDTNLTGASGVTNPFVSDASTRYAYGDTTTNPVNNTPTFCSGDALFGDNNPLTTTYVVRQPDPTPSDYTNNPIVEDPTGPAVCTPLQFQGYNGDLSHALKQGDAAYNANPWVAQVFRQWVPICTIQGDGQAHDYVLQVLTDVRFVASTTTGIVPAAALTDGTFGFQDGYSLKTDPTTPGGGHNRFAMRAIQVLNSGNGTGGCTPVNGTPNGNTNYLKVGTPLQYYTSACHMYDTTAGAVADQAAFSLAGNGKMSLYVNTGAGAATQFYLARVLPTSSGQTLDLNFYDINDCSGCSPTLQVLQPAGSSGTAWGTTSKCTVSAATTPSATSQSPLTNCTLSSDPSFNAHWVTISVPIPSDYNCVVATTTACWVQIKITYGSGATIADTTTWSANISGDPVRLIK